MSVLRCTIKLISLMALAFLTACTDSTHLPSEDSLREIRQGKLIGFGSTEFAHSWQGIPFAQAPVGDNRWRAPLSAKAWGNTLQALEHAPACVQLKLLDGIKGSEDCLYLNVYAPQLTQEEVSKLEAPLPVMLWIHGGSNVTGGAHIYNGSYLAAQQKVIVVTIQYRLGILGWFQHRSINDQSNPSPNYALLDIIQSLQWVKENISSFGGDPDLVTIFGESAGGKNVLALLHSPMAKGLFHRAISQSGGAWSVSSSSAENFSDASQDVTTEKGAAVVQNGHRNSSNEIILNLLRTTYPEATRTELKRMAQKSSNADLKEALLAMSFEELLTATNHSSRPQRYSAPTVIRDGIVIPKNKAGHSFAVLGDQSQAFESDVPVMLGSNRDEDKFFMLITSDLIDRFIGIPRKPINLNLFNATAEYRSLIWRVSAADHPAARAYSEGKRDIFTYRFDWDEEPTTLGTDMSVLAGAAHATEIPFVFGSFDLGFFSRFIFDNEKSEQDKLLSQTMMSYWAEFAYTGNPGTGRDKNLSPWTAWHSGKSHDAGEAQGNTMILDSDSDQGIRMEFQFYTRDEVVQLVIDDTRFESWQQRCAILSHFVTWTKRMTISEYDTVADGACEKHAIIRS